MRTAKIVLSTILVVALLSSGVPLFAPEDANRDSFTNLEDAILNVRDFTQTADSPAVFTSKVKKVLSTLHVVAGLKTNIVPAKDSKSTNTLYSLDLPYLICTLDFSIPAYNSLPVLEKPFIYSSVVVTPTPPPPRAV
jgi:hypothetical protein